MLMKPLLLLQFYRRIGLRGLQRLPKHRPECNRHGNDGRQDENPPIAVNPVRIAAQEV